MGPSRVSLNEEQSDGGADAAGGAASVSSACASV